MARGKILYFAYGSNMLSQRLIDRCPSAKAIGAAVVDCHYLDFGLAGRDGSGKAVIIKTQNQDDKVFGVVFELTHAELSDLDEFEVKYERNDDFEVMMAGQLHKTSTYYVPKAHLEIGLVPMDWYRDICVAGAKQHGLDADYIAGLEALSVHQDPDNEGHKYLPNLV